MPRKSKVVNCCDCGVEVSVQEAIDVAGEYMLCSDCFFDGNDDDEDSEDMGLCNEDMGLCPHGSAADEGCGELGCGGGPDGEEDAWDDD